MEKDRKINNPYDMSGICIRCGSAREIGGCFDCKQLKKHKEKKENYKR